MNFKCETSKRLFFFNLTYRNLLFKLLIDNNIIFPVKTKRQKQGFSFLFLQINMHGTCKTQCHAVLTTLFTWQAPQNHLSMRNRMAPVVNLKWREPLRRFHALRVFCNYLAYINSFIMEKLKIFVVSPYSRTGGRLSSTAGQNRGYCSYTGSGNINCRSCGAPQPSSTGLK